MAYTSRKWDQPPQPPPRCPGCAGSRGLDLSQPDKGNPSRLLGSCRNPSCGAWTEFVRDDHTGHWIVRSRTAKPARTG